MLKLKVGQIYNFGNEKNYYIINSFDKDDIWIQIWTKDENYIWTKIYSGEIIFKDIDFISKYEFEQLFNDIGKYIGIMNKDYGLNNNWNLVEKKYATKIWFTMENL